MTKESLMAAGYDRELSLALCEVDHLREGNAELLAAIEAIVEYAQSQSGSVDDGKYMGRIIREQLLHDAQAAINRAKGESQ